MKQSESEILLAIRKGYETGEFGDLFPYMTEDYEHISFWVIEVLRGREQAQAYYEGKGCAIRNGGSDTEFEWVRIVSAPDKVRPKGIWRGGIRALEDACFLHRTDAGKTSLLMTQHLENEDVRTLAVPTFTDDGMIRQILIANPGFYELEPAKDMERG